MSEKTNQGLKVTDIKGKGYVEVNERIRYFRENYDNHSLVSKLISLEGGVCVFEAQVLNPDREVVANGFAYEKEGSTFINKTSYIENCETSAWGRALANFGIGVDTSVASAEEVGNAIENQKEFKTQSKSTEDEKREYKKQFVSFLKSHDVSDVLDFFNFLGVDHTDEKTTSNIVSKFLKSAEHFENQIESYKLYKVKQISA